MSNLTGRRIPSLDGIRAISIQMVLYGHLCGTRHFPVAIAEYGRWCRCLCGVLGFAGAHPNLRVMSSVRMDSLSLFAPKGARSPEAACPADGDKLDKSPPCDAVGRLPPGFRQKRYGQETTCASRPLDYARWLTPECAAP
jgi:hypothetical protein